MTPPRVFHNGCSVFARIDCISDTTASTANHKGKKMAKNNSPVIFTVTGRTLFCRRSVGVTMIMIIPVLKHCQVLSFFKPTQVFRGFILYRNPDHTCICVIFLWWRTSFGGCCIQVVRNRVNLQENEIEAFKAMCHRWILHGSILVRCCIERHNLFQS